MGPLGVASEEPKSPQVGAEKPKITIRKYEVPIDPSASVYHVTMEVGIGVWEETLTSEENLRWFLRGLQAGASPWAMIYPPDIPHSALPLPTMRPIEAELHRQLSLDGIGEGERSGSDQDFPPMPDEESDDLPF
jgi:hypothetical protein